MMMRREPSTAQIHDAVKHLQAGELVAFPTETVYGLGADARNPQAVKRIFALKGRPADHPVIVHIAAATELSQWAVNIPPEASILAEAFWPGPLTLILPKHPHVLPVVTGGQETVGIRVPSHPVAAALLQAFREGVAAPSANKFGHISPTSASHVRADFGEGLYVLEGEAAEVGLESTIIDLSSKRPALLRPGGITLADITALIGEVDVKPKHAPRASGMLKVHYAPHTPATLVTREVLQNLPPEKVRRCGVLSFLPPPLEATSWYTMPDNARGYAKQLYHYLRSADEQEIECILIEQVPNAPSWLAVRDRLERATAT